MTPRGKMSSMKETKAMLLLDVHTNSANYLTVFRDERDLRDDLAKNSHKPLFAPENKRC